jgi:5,10-methylenetetrahydromethanopterin reductase
LITDVYSLASSPRIAEKTNRIKFGPAVLIPSYRHPMAQASAIATLEQIAPGRLMVGFGTGFTGRARDGQKGFKPREHAYAYHAG